jgi:hypothetical protein
MEFSFCPDRRGEIVESLRPDVVFASRDGLPPETLILDASGVDFDHIGFGPDQILARRWARLLTLKTTEGWRRDFVPEDKRSEVLQISFCC